MDQVFRQKSFEFLELKLHNLLPNTCKFIIRISKREFEIFIIEFTRDYFTKLSMKIAPPWYCLAKTKY